MKTFFKRWFISADRARLVANFSKQMRHDIEIDMITTGEAPLHPSPTFRARTLVASADDDLRVVFTTDAHLILIVTNYFVRGARDPRYHQRLSMVFDISDEENKTNFT